MRLLALILSIIAVAVAAKDGQGPEQLGVAGLLHSKKDEGDIQGRTEDEGHGLLQASNTLLHSVVGESSAVKDLRSNDSAVSHAEWGKWLRRSGMRSSRMSRRNGMRSSRGPRRSDYFRGGDAHKAHRLREAARIGDEREAARKRDEKKKRDEEEKKEREAERKRDEKKRRDEEEKEKRLVITRAADRRKYAAEMAPAYRAARKAARCRSQRIADYMRRCSPGDWGASSKGDAARARLYAHMARLGKGFTTTTTTDPWQTRRRGCPLRVIKDCYANRGRFKR